MGIVLAIFRSLILTLLASNALNDVKQADIKNSYVKELG
ncbi:hypothetical protein P20429_1624 [Pseudoalteromonas sp. BSi20429]|nr:hypothetical protein P20429_1624 [Pseudoalteromonas sp. BSi20429]